MKRRTLVMAGVVAAMLVLAAPAMALDPGPELVTNGDFEAGNAGFTSELVYIVNDPAFDMYDPGTYVLGMDPNDFHAAWGSFADHTPDPGVNMMIINAAEDPTKVVWKQTIPVMPGRDYAFSLWCASSYGTNLANLDIQFNGVSVGSKLAPATPGVWEEFTATWPSGTATEVEIAVYDTTGEFDGDDYALDDISLRVINYPSDIESYKWYDLDMDGVNDWAPESPASNEQGIGGWLITLWKDGALVDKTLTGPDGWYRFEGLAPGTYKIKEGVGGCCWMQTFPASPANFYTVVITGDGATLRCQTRFGNVCKRCVKGYTMGFWSNKNGLRALKAYAGADGIIENIPKYGPMSVAEIQAMAQAANAVDMCVMLKAQFVAHWLSVNLMGADYSDAAIVMAPGDIMDYDDAMAEFAAFDCSTASRSEAEEWKDLFDGLNNNRYPVVEYWANRCAVPTCWVKR